MIDSIACRLAFLAVPFVPLLAHDNSSFDLALILKVLTKAEVMQIKQIMNLLVPWMPLPNTAGKSRFQSAG